MAGIFEALLAMIGFGVLLVAAWAAFVADTEPSRDLRAVRRTAEAEMRRAADHLRGKEW